MVDIETFIKIAFSFPKLTEEPHFEKISFRVRKKFFATFDIKMNLVCEMLSEIDQSVFSAYDNTIIFPVPNKWGKKLQHV
ncbi:MAG: MmcQ/YjbR family DNA-binding protein [Saprospiraceae bacterium]